MSGHSHRSGGAAVFAIAAAAVLQLSACTSGPSARDLAMEYYNLGNEYLALGRWDKAGEYYDKAIRYDSSLATASYNLVRALAEGGKYEKALEIVDSLLGGDGDNAEFLALKAYVLYRAGRVEEALAVYDRIAALDEFDFPTALNRCAILVELERYDEAQASLAELEKVKPDDETVIRRIALVAMKREDWLTAERYLSAYLAKKANDAAARIDLAGVYERLERYKDAMDLWAAIAGADSKNKDAWFALARLRLTVAHDASGGMEALNKAIDAGFSDKQAIEALLAAKDLAAREEVTALFREKKLLE
ncbi:MAG: tetratricopeptide repeat protein [Spirochaetes bacterium]|nr:tetratricopeptide repeat protein [Spirochaetota bacterium]